MVCILGCGSESIVSMPRSLRQARVSDQRVRAALMSPLVARMKRKGMVCCVLEDGVVFVFVFAFAFAPVGWDGDN